MTAEAKDVRTQMLEGLRAWGGGLIGMGLLHCFVVRHRAMFLVIGASLALIGVLNGLGGLVSDAGFWTLFGVIQAYWGIGEVAKFGKYKHVPKAGRPAENQTLESEAA